MIIRNCFGINHATRKPAHFRLHLDQEDHLQKWSVTPTTFISQ